MFKLQTLSIVKKMIISLAIPTLLLFAFVGRGAYQEYKTLKELQISKQLIDICASFSAIITETLSERTLSLKEIRDKDLSDHAELELVRKNIDQLFEKLFRLTEEYQSNVPNDAAEINALLMPVRNTAQQLVSMRKSIDDKAASVSGIRALYTNIVLVNKECLRIFPHWVNNGDVFRRLLGFSNLTYAVETLGNQRMIVSNIIDEKATSPSNYFELIKTKDLFEAYIDVFTSLKFAKFDDMYKDQAKSIHFLEMKGMVDRLITLGIDKPVKDFPSRVDWVDKQNKRIAAISFIKDELCNDSLKTISILEKSAIEMVFTNIGLFLTAIALAGFISSFILIRMKKDLAIIRTGLDCVSSGDLTHIVPLNTKDEFGKIAEFINSTLIVNLTAIMQQLKKTMNALSSTVTDLSKSSREISTTSNQQSAGVKEVVSTMEDTDQLSKQISNKIGLVLNAIEDSQREIDTGFSIIQKNQNTMNEIKTNSETTIEGIKHLGKQINSIWDIVNIINGIADQTKIIAFNAELEASSAGESGKNFQIVATEIRRLADNTVSSTSQIKNKIEEIQKSSDLLVVTAESGTDKIETGWSLSKNLQEVFEAILKKSTLSINSSKEVTTSVSQQVSAFEQIVLTMKQISDGISLFTHSISGIVKISENLQSISDDIQTIIKTYKVAETNTPKSTIKEIIAK